MPLFSLLKPTAGICPLCHEKAGLLRREHPDSRRTHQAGWNEMVQLAADAGGSYTFA